ncbi:MAG: SIMPL domain-containing protein [Haloferacaceae archaeon]
MRRQTLIAAGLAVMLLVAGCSAGTGSSGTEGTEGRTIQVVGSGSAEGEPNQAVVDVAVVETADDAAAARRKLAENVSRMRTALESIGIEDDQVTTRRYDIDRDLRRPRREGGEPRTRYRAVHAFEITLSEIDRVGTVIDTAVRNGASQVENIEFTLSTDRRRQLERSARDAAMANAREKAEDIAASANLTVTGVRTVRTGGGEAPRSVESGAAAAATPTATLAAPSDVEAGPVTVVVTVRVVYDAAPAEGTSEGAA